MAVPARRDDVRVRQTAPALRLIRGEGRGRADSARSTSARSESACRGTFLIALCMLMVAVIVGMGRVALTVKATEAAVAASALSHAIELERINKEQLEQYRSALAAPPRIQALAEGSMKMSSAGRISYIELVGNGAGCTQDSVPPGGAEDGQSAGVVDRMLSSIMRMTAGEAQVLLVGGAGLTSSR